MHAVLIVSLLCLQEPTDLVDRLGHPSIHEREAAEKALVKLGSRAVPALERGLLSRDPGLRKSARKLLHELDSPSALIEDLRSDDVRGNAKSARNKLLRAFSPRIRTLLLQAVRSDDDQQSLQAAFVLLNKGAGKQALEAEPRLLRRAAAAFCRGETDRYDWVAGHVLLKSAACMKPDLVDAEYRIALMGVSPGDLWDPLLWARDLSRQLKLPFPRPMLRRYLLNFRDDNRYGNSWYARMMIRNLGKTAVPCLLELLKDEDAQARQLALLHLLRYPDIALPEIAIPILGEILAYHRGALARLLDFGDKAVPVLRKALRSRNQMAQVRAAVGLLRRKLGDEAISVLIRNLGTDTYRKNGRESALALIEAGDAAIDPLQALLASPDEQAVTFAAGILARLGKLGKLSRASEDQIFRFSRREWPGDEWNAHLLLFDSSSKVAERVLGRLAASGKQGAGRALEISRRLRKWSLDDWRI